jgi:6-phosphogluconolactonase
VTPDGHYAYVTNTGSASVTGYRVSPDGRVSLLDADGVTGQTGTTPIDLAFAGEGAFLYTLNSAAHSISGFGRGQDGGLTPLDATATLPAGANGMVAW